MHGVSNTLVYLDDIIVYSNSYAEHVKHLDVVLGRLNEYGLVVNLRKSSFFQTKVVYW